MMVQFLLRIASPAADISIHIITFSLGKHSPPFICLRYPVAKIKQNAESNKAEIGDTFPRHTERL